MRKKILSNKMGITMVGIAILTFLFSYQTSYINPEEGRLYGLAILVVCVSIAFATLCVSYAKLRIINQSEGLEKYYDWSKTLEYLILTLIGLLLSLLVGVITRLSDNPETTWLYIFVINAISVIFLTMTIVLISFFKINIQNPFKNKSQDSVKSSILPIVTLGTLIYWPSIIWFVIVLVLLFFVAIWISGILHP